MSLANLYNQTGAVYRATTEQNAMGASRDTFAVSTASVPCRIRAVSAHEREMSGAIGVEVSHRMYCAGSVSITEADEFRVGTTIYDVQHVNDVDGMGHHLEVDLLERRPDRHGRA